MGTICIGCSGAICQVRASCGDQKLDLSYYAGISVAACHIIARQTLQAKMMIIRQRQKKSFPLDLPSSLVF